MASQEWNQVERGWVLKSVKCDIGMNDTACMMICWHESLFLQCQHGLVKSLWFLPFAYVFLARNTCSIAKALCSGGTLKAWWNSQQIWVLPR
ncbi:hypothetical protein I3843_03G000900 [Carya illinoinensis]|uniref:Uncharacterized protein n=1 Tax=Carya illinoinensis TaxID=32201 RepID=A0A922A593_CARIL|nr:hypothetical protein I3842_Q001100 [Carya illinoinensis]KAG6621756.1 hypothetical protein I3842_Q001100 [Carya illinoinensis]KAG7984978.1 hypothetical protein I3843_03G000900 [Carya illinoinensis]KAG7984979.1 hypothetical protein I3843_03G000900 [Carya illinoinensis]